MPALIDTGFLLAVLDADEELHEACVGALRQEPTPLLPDVVIPELGYMIARNLGHSVLAAFFRSLAAGQLRIVQSETDDFARAAEVVERYADNRPDPVDCVIVALAERLDIRRILTVDERHFRVFRPRHCATFEIVP